MGRLFPYNCNMIGWVTLTTLSECHTKTNTKTRAKTKSKLKTTFPSIIALLIGWIIKSSSNDFHTESKTKCTQLPYLNLKYLMAFLTRTVLSTFDIDTLSLPFLSYKILLLCRNSFRSWKPVLKRLSSVGWRAMPRERTLFVEEENHLLAPSALYHSAHHTLQKVKVSKLKCQTKSVKVWKCEPLFAEEANHLLGPFSLSHYTMCSAPNTAKVSEWKCETLFVEEANHLFGTFILN